MTSVSRTTAFINEFNRQVQEAKRQDKDSVWSRVERVALSSHFSQTGNLILTCLNPEERRYRFIPAKELTETLQEIDSTDDLSEVVKNLISLIAEEPDLFKPGCFEAPFSYNQAFDAYVHLYFKVIKDGCDTPFLDVISSPPDKMYVLIKGDNPEIVAEQATSFISTIEHEVSKIHAGLSKILNFVQEHPSKKSDEKEHIVAVNLSLGKTEELLSYFSNYPFVMGVFNLPPFTPNAREINLNRLSQLATIFKQKRDEVQEKKRAQQLGMYEFMKKEPATIPKEAEDHPYYQWIRTSDKEAGSICSKSCSPREKSSDNATFMKGKDND